MNSGGDRRGIAWDAKTEFCGGAFALDFNQSLMGDPKCIAKVEAEISAAYAQFETSAASLENLEGYLRHWIEGPYMHCFEESGIGSNGRDKSARTRGNQCMSEYTSGARKIVITGESPPHPTFTVFGEFVPWAVSQTKAGVPSSKFAADRIVVPHTLKATLEKASELSRVSAREGVRLFRDALSLIKPDRQCEASEKIAAEISAWYFNELIPAFLVAKDPSDRPVLEGLITAATITKMGEDYRPVIVWPGHPELVKVTGKTPLLANKARELFREALKWLSPSEYKAAHEAIAKDIREWADNILTSGKETDALRVFVGGINDDFSIYIAQAPEELFLPATYGFDWMKELPPAAVKEITRLYASEYRRLNANGIAVGIDVSREDVAQKIISIVKGAMESGDGPDELAKRLRGQDLHGVGVLRKGFRHNTSWDDEIDAAVNVNPPTSFKEKLDIVGQSHPIIADVAGSLFEEALAHLDRSSREVEKEKIAAGVLKWVDTCLDAAASGHLKGDDVIGTFVFSIGDDMGIHFKKAPPKLFNPKEIGFDSASALPTRARLELRRLFIEALEKYRDGYGVAVVTDNRLAILGDVVSDLIRAKFKGMGNIDTLARELSEIGINRVAENVMRRGNQKKRAAAFQLAPRI